MNEVYIKKRWEEDNVIYFIHFRNNIAIRQIEIYPDKEFYLSSSNPIIEDSMLYDQSIETLDIEYSDIISKDEFESIWNKKKL